MPVTPMTSKENFMEWLTENWITVALLAGVGWVMFKGGGCCGGGKKKQQHDSSPDDAAPAPPANASGGLH